MTSPGFSHTGGRRRHAHPRGCSGVDQVSWFEHQELTEIVDDETGVKDHGRRGPVLATYAANIEPHREVEHIVELIRRNEPWSGRVEGFRRFALGQLSAAFELEGAFAHVVHNREPGDGGVGVFNRVEIAGSPADHDTQLDLPVGFGRPARDADVIIRADECVRRLGEQDRFVGDRRARLGGVIAAIQADTQDLVGPGNGAPTR